MLREMQVGDLIYIPARDDDDRAHGRPAVRHPRHHGHLPPDENGEITRVNLNGVAVTQLVPLLDGKDTSRVDRIYSIQRIRK